MSRNKKQAPNRGLDASEALLRVRREGSRRNAKRYIG